MEFTDAELTYIRDTARHEMVDLVNLAEDKRDKNREYFIARKKLLEQLLKKIDGV